MCVCVCAYKKITHVHHNDGMYPNNITIRAKEVGSSLYLVV